MTNKDNEIIRIYVDPRPSELFHSFSSKQRQKFIAQKLRHHFEEEVNGAVDRYLSLPELRVYDGGYTLLLREARNLYIYGYYYSCVAMCGVSAERISKDLFITSISIRMGAKVVQPPKECIANLESFGVKQICDFLINAGVIKQSLRPAFRALGKLRNDYAHAGGKKPEEDAKEAIGHLHTIVEGTVSSLMDFDIKNGKYIRKPAPVL